jgi:hypothetical protein
VNVRLRRIVWFVALWIGGVLAAAALAYGVRAVIALL